MPKRLSPAKRVANALRVKRGDRVPILAFIQDHAARLANCSVKDLCQDSDKLLEAQKAVMSNYGFDNLTCPAEEITIEAEALGCRLYFLDESVPVILDHPMRLPVDLYRLPVPDPEKDGRMPFVLETVEKLKEEFGKDVPLVGVVAGPLSLAIAIRGIRGVFYDIHMSEEFAKNVLNFCADVIADYADAVTAAGADIIYLADPWASIPPFSPSFFEKFVCPLMERVLDTLRGYARVYWRIKGLSKFKEPSRILDWFLEICPDFGVVAGEPDLTALGYEFFREKARENRVPLTFVLPPGIFFRGAEAVKDKVYDYLVQGAPGEGLLIVAEKIPYEAPIESVKAAVEVVEEYGILPIHVAEET